VRSKIPAIGLLFMVCLSSCISQETLVPPTQTSTPTLTSTSTAVPTTPPDTSTPTPTLVPTNSSCQLPIRGTYNYSNSNVVFNLSPGVFLFYDKPGGGKFSNDQAGCELNYDCTQLRAINKDSAESNPKGVIGPWVDLQTGTSTAQWHEYIVTCSFEAQ
jgi:hypothetical protein